MPQELVEGTPWAQWFLLCNLRFPRPLHNLSCTPFQILLDNSGPAANIRPACFLENESSK